MSQSPPAGGYPPPPGGAPARDPYAQDHALSAWAAERGYALSTQPDLRWYQGWAPFTYQPRPHRLGREVRAVFGDATLWAVEWVEDDPVKQATGDDRHLVALITSPRLGARAALRSKQGGGVVNEISVGLNSLFGSKPAPGAALGDPTLESAYDVSVPSRDEGDRALPMPLRRFLVGAGFRGVLELRQGGMLLDDYSTRRFEPATLDGLIHRAGQAYQLAVGAAG